MRVDGRRRTIDPVASIRQPLANLRFLVLALAEMCARTCCPDASLQLTFSVGQHRLSANRLLSFTMKSMLIKSPGTVASLKDAFSFGVQWILAIRARPANLEEAERTD